MAESLADIFRVNPTITRLVVLGYDDNEPYGLSEDHQVLRMLDPLLAEALATLEHANSSIGHTTADGFVIRGSYYSEFDEYKASVSKAPQAGQN